MSGYTIGEIIIWLLLATALGFALGWIARELVARRKPGPTSTVVVPPPVQAAEPARSPAKKAAAKKAPAKKAPAKKATARKAPAKKAAKKTPAKKTTPPNKPDNT